MQQVKRYVINDWLVTSVKCEECQYALWDCEEYYCSTEREWFVEDCKAGLDEETCEGPY